MFQEDIYHKKFIQSNIIQDHMNMRRIEFTTPTNGYMPKTGQTYSTGYRK